MNQKELHCKNSACVLNGSETCFQQNVIIIMFKHHDV